MSIYKKFKSQKGITIVEALVSLLVLSLGLVPSLAIISSSVNTSSLIKNNLIAANIAQEGVEIIRSLRDSNWFLNKPNFYDGLMKNGNIFGKWQVDWNTNWTSNPPLDVDNVGVNPLKYDSATGLYNYSTGVDTIFSRFIMVFRTGNLCDCELKILSFVIWTQYSQSKVITIDSYLYDWK